MTLRPKVVVSLDHDSLETDVEDVRLAMLGVLLYRGIIRATAEIFDNDWKWLDDEGFVKCSFIPWERLRGQYSMRIMPSGAQLVLDNLPKAVSAILSLTASIYAEFLVQFMATEDLPMLLSHESSDLRELATVRLKELAEEQGVDKPTAGVVDQDMQPDWR